MILAVWGAKVVLTLAFETVSSLCSPRSYGSSVGGVPLGKLRKSY